MVHIRQQSVPLDTVSEQLIAGFSARRASIAYQEMLVCASLTLTATCLHDSTSINAITSPLPNIAKLLSQP